MLLDDSTRLTTRRLRRRRTIPRLPFRREFFQILHPDRAQRALISRMQKDPTPQNNQSISLWNSTTTTSYTKETTYLGTTGSLSSFLASIASFQRDVQRHHLQPPVRPMVRRSLPREAEKSRNSSVTTAERRYSP